MAELPHTGEAIHGFTLTETGSIHMLGAKTYLFHHETSGVQLLYIQNQDRELGFNLIYRTPQTDGRDTSHILEHLLLSSCKKYPSRDIFFDMDSKSYATFMNGLTDNTFTCYPVCTQSQKQLLKLMDVFLCCMEEPDAMEDPYFYKREAIRWELDGIKGPLQMQGTVLGEDWGHLTDLFEQADSAMAETLYENKSASFLLGRAHLHYRELSFDQAKEAFKRCYHYSNCLITLYGDVELDSILEFLDREHLSHYPAASENLLSAFHEPVTPGFRRQTSQSPAYAGSPKEHASVIDYAIDLSGCNPEGLLCWDFFADMLDHDTSPLRRHGKEAGLHQMTEVFLDLLLPHPSLKFRLHNGDPGQEEGFLSVIQKTLEEIHQSGLSLPLYQGTLKENRMSDSLTGESPHLGFGLSEEIGRFWSTTGRTDYFELYETMFRQMEQDKEQRIIKQLAKQALNPTASALVTTVPVPGMAEQMEEERALYLKEQLDSMDLPSRLRLIEETKKFRRRNVQEWGSMDFLIKPKELPKPPAPPSFLREELEAVTCLTSPCASSDVGNYQLYFDLSGLHPGDWDYLTLYQMLLTELDTPKLTSEQQKHREQEYLHDCTFDELYPEEEAGEMARPMMTVCWYSLAKDFGKSLECLLDIMEGGDYSQSHTILQILEKYLPDYDLSRGENASSLSFTLSEAGLRHDCRFRSLLNGQENYYFLKETARRLKEEPDFGMVLAQRLRSIAETILRQEHMVFLAAAPQDFLGVIKAEVKKQLAPLRDKAPLIKPVPQAIALPSLPRRLAVCVDISSQETRLTTSWKARRCSAAAARGLSPAASGSISPETAWPAFKGRYLPFLMAASDKYIKPAVRYQRGAYDSGIDFYLPAGCFSLWSTADPQVSATLKLFLDTGKQLMNLSLTQKELDGYILNAYSQALPPCGDLNERMRHMRRSLAGIDSLAINEMIEDIKNARICHQKEAALAIDRLLQSGFIVTVGNETQIRKESGFFEQVTAYHS